MEYKGYNIIVDVDVNEQWNFELVNGKVHLTDFIDNGGVDEDNIVDFVIQHDGYEEFEDFYDTLEDAKKAIDRVVNNG